jgi:hypothetical protein
MTMHVPSSISGSTSSSLGTLIWPGLLERDALSSPTGSFPSDVEEVVEDREASESAALSRGLEVVEDREASESAALSGGLDLEGTALSGSAALNEGREARVDFLEVVFPGAETL